MVIAYHLILTGYGHWLPNDPRGSMSEEVAAGKLFPLGAPHYGRKRVQPQRDELRAFQRKARALLEHDPIWFDPAKRQAIAEAFGEVVRARRYTCYACAILSNHAHLVIRKHRDKAETMMRELEIASTTRLCRFADVPNDHPVWSGRPYKRFLDTPKAAARTIRYVEDNPGKSRLPRQTYDFVRPYRGEWRGKRKT